VSCGVWCVVEWSVCGVWCLHCACVWCVVCGGVGGSGSGKQAPPDPSQWASGTPPLPYHPSLSCRHTHLSLACRHTELLDGGSVRVTCLMEAHGGSVTRTRHSHCHTHTSYPIEAVSHARVIATVTPTPPTRSRQCHTHASEAVSHARVLPPPHPRSS